jgi:hypothetical protein
MAVVVSTNTQSQPTPTDLESRFVKGCVKDGDTEAYCRCDFAATKGAVKDTKELELIVVLTEKTAGLPPEQQDAIFQALPPEQLQRLVELTEQLDPIVMKCPDYKPR